MYDVIIIGQGLAGSVLAITLINKGKNVFVIDELPEISSSKVAPGVVNPVALKRLLLSWKADLFVPFAENFYAEAAVILGKKVYQQRQMFHVFHDERAVKEWFDKKEKIPFLGEISGKSDPVIDPFGGGMIGGAGNLNTYDFVTLTTEYLKEKNIFRKENFDFPDFNPQKGTYKDLSAKQFVFCEGWKMLWNPYFSWLPMAPTKGEVVEGRAEKEIPSEMLHKSVFILPSGEKTFKAGGTFDRVNLDEKLTVEAKEEISAGIKKVLACGFEITGQKAGIRPTVLDRRPLLGFHPEHKNVAVFNGLGSKGVMMAPFLAEEMWSILEGKESLLPEANISRFKRN